MCMYYIQSASSIILFLKISYSMSILYHKQGHGEIYIGNIGISALFFNIGISAIGKHFIADIGTPLIIGLDHFLGHMHEVMKLYDRQFS